MPALPWIQRQEIDRGRTYIAMGSQLPLVRHRSIPAFLHDTLRVRRQSADASGLVGYALNAGLIDKTFWTFSVWDDQASLDAFAAADPHQRFTRRLAARMGRTHFGVWAVRGEEFPGAGIASLRTLQWRRLRRRARLDS